MIQTTLCFIHDDSRVLLAMKKRGFGKGKYNGYGGKQRLEETLVACAIREIKEEIGVSVQQEHLINRGYIDFFFAEKPEWNQRVHLYAVAQYNGEPQESDEMHPEWFDLPLTEEQYNNMWIDDKYWLPKFLEGEQIQAAFTFGGMGEGSWIQDMQFTVPKDYNPMLQAQDRGPKHA